MAKQKVENISFTQGWDGYRMNLAIMEGLQRYGKTLENTKHVAKTAGFFPQLASFLMFGVSDPKLQICGCFCRSEVEKLKPEDADEIDEIATASGDERRFLMYQ